MKIVIAGDVHVSTNSSIVRGRGSRYSKRLENCIDSINWVEEQAEDCDADLVVYIGDFFDKAELNAEEITALTDMGWSEMKHYVLVGNHELGNAAGDYSTAHILGLLPNFCVVSSTMILESDYSSIVLLPYIVDENDRVLPRYDTSVTSKNRIVISHNDIKGVNYGSFTSTSGFDLEDIKHNCNLFVNGHIHNGQKLNDHPAVINIGNLTGQNFSEDASKYPHHIMIVDDSDLSIKYVDNPYAYNFYKLTITNRAQVDNIRLKDNAVLDIKCPESLKAPIQEKLYTIPYIEAVKFTTEREKADEETVEKIETLTKVDYLDQFKNYVIEKVGSDAVTLKEIQEVLYAD